MLVKGIIEEKINIYQYKVRIPLINKASYNSNPTLHEELSAAPICAPTGLTPIYNKGDIVFIDFENGDLGNPVILGTLLRQNADKSSYSNIDVATLNVYNQCVLPVDTAIGNIQSQDVNSVLSSYDVITSLLDASGGSSVEEAAQEDVDTAEAIFN